MQYEWNMSLPSWATLMKDHSECVMVSRNGRMDASSGFSGHLDLRLNSEEQGGMILFCNICGNEICSVRR